MKMYSEYFRIFFFFWWPITFYGVQTQENFELRIV